MRTLNITEYLKQNGIHTNNQSLKFISAATRKRREAAGGKLFLQLPVAEHDVFLLRRNQQHARKRRWRHPRSLSREVVSRPGKWQQSHSVLY